jgi:hypothetical protein
VTISPAELRAQLATAKLPSWISQLASHLNFGPMHYYVYINSSGLLQRATVDMSESVSSTDVTIDETYDLSNYGVPVSISAPAPSQTVSFQQLLQAAAAENNGESTS